MLVIGNKATFARAQLRTRISMVPCGPLHIEKHIDYSQPTTIRCSHAVGLTARLISNAACDY